MVNENEEFHDDIIRYDEDIDEVSEYIRTLRKTPYYQYITTAEDYFIGKKIVNFYAGYFGYILIFSDNSAALIYLHNGYLDWKVYSNVKKDCCEIIRGAELIYSKSAPVDKLKLYVEALSDGVSHEISYLSIDENTFSIGFESDWKIDSYIFKDKHNNEYLYYCYEYWGNSDEI